MQLVMPVNYWFKRWGWLPVLVGPLLVGATYAWFDQPRPIHDDFDASDYEWMQFGPGERRYELGLSEGRTVTVIADLLWPWEEERPRHSITLGVADGLAVDISYSYAASLLEPARAAVDAWQETFGPVPTQQISKRRIWVSGRGPSGEVHLVLFAPMPRTYLALTCQAVVNRPEMLPVAENAIRTFCESLRMEP